MKKEYPEPQRPVSFEYTATKNKRDPTLNKMESKEGLITRLCANLPMYTMAWMQQYSHMHTHTGSYNTLNSKKHECWKYFKHIHTEAMSINPSKQPKPKLILPAIIPILYPTGHIFLLYLPNTYFLWHILLFHLRFTYQRFSIFS